MWRSRGRVRQPPVVSGIENTDDVADAQSAPSDGPPGTEHAGERASSSTCVGTPSTVLTRKTTITQCAATAASVAADLINFPVVPGETRLISDVGLDDASAVPAELAFWMRCGDFTDPALARPVLAYVSDWPLIGTLLKAVPGTSQQDAHVRVRTGVVSHSIWFHQPFDVSEWLRVEIRGERLAGGRGFVIAAVYTQGGLLVAPLRSRERDQTLRIKETTMQQNSSFGTRRTARWR